MLKGVKFYYYVLIISKLKVMKSEKRRQVIDWHCFLVTVHLSFCRIMNGRWLRSLRSRHPHKSVERMRRHHLHKGNPALNRRLAYHHLQPRKKKARQLPLKVRVEFAFSVMMGWDIKDFKITLGTRVGYVRPAGTRSRDFYYYHLCTI